MAEVQSTISLFLDNSIHFSTYQPIAMQCEYIGLLHGILILMSYVAHELVQVDPYHFPNLT